MDETASPEQEKEAKMPAFRLFSLQKRGCLFTFSSSGHIAQSTDTEWFALDFASPKSANFRGGRVANLPSPKALPQKFEEYIEEENAGSLTALDAQNAPNPTWGDRLIFDANFRIGR